jgi:ABC-type transport system involved in multi-copper enzyme maturation permease subunit
MSGISASAAPPVGAARVERPGGEGVTLGRVIRSEWTKLWSLRSTRWSLLVAFVAQAGLGVLVAVVTMSRWDRLGLGERLHFSSIDRSLAGYHIAQLAIGVLGVLVISGEYSTGQIRSSLMAVPKRLPVLWAKILTFAAVTFVLMLLASLIGFFAAQAIFTQHHVNVSLGHPGAMRAVIGNVLYMTATGVLCTALGAIVRATAGGISAFVALLFVLPGIVEILPSDVANSISPYLPSNAGAVVAQAVRGSHSLSPWGGFALFCCYTAVAVIVAAYLLRRRDA